MLWGYIFNPCSLKEGTETSHPVATVAVPQLSCRITGLAPQWKYELMLCICCLLYPRCRVWQPDAKYHMPMSIGSFSYTQNGLVYLARSQIIGHQRLCSLLQGTKVIYITKMFYCNIKMEYCSKNIVLTLLKIISTEPENPSEGKSLDWILSLIKACMIICRHFVFFFWYNCKCKPASMVG